MLKMKTMIAFLALFILKISGLLRHDVRAKGIKLSFFWTSYAVIIRFMGLAGLHAWKKTELEFQGEFLTAFMSIAIVVLNYISCIMSSLVLTLRSKKLAHLAHTIIYDDDQLWSLHTFWHSLLTETLLITSMLTSVASIINSFADAYPTSLALWLRIILIITEAVFLAGSIVAIAAFRCFCHALVGALQNSKKNVQNIQKDSIICRKAIENFEICLHKVERKKNEVTELFSWNVTMLILGTTAMICLQIAFIALHGFNMWSITFILPPFQFMYAVYCSGQMFLDEVNSIRRDLAEASVTWTEDLQSPVRRVLALLDQMADFSINGAYSLKFSSLVTVLNSGIGWIVLLLQIGRREDPDTLAATT